jgi:hypothetical protein
MELRSGGGASQVTRATWGAVGHALALSHRAQANEKVGLTLRAVACAWQNDDDTPRGDVDGGHKTISERH